MAPLTLGDKYDDLVHCADQPISAYERLSHDDLDDVIGNVWPYIIESITSCRLPIEQTNESISDVRVQLERRLKIQFQLYSEAARRQHQMFPNRRPIRLNRVSTENIIDSHIRSVSFVRKDEADIETNVPDFYVFCSPKVSHISSGWHQSDYDRVRKYLMTSPQISLYRMLIFRQALKECCHCGNYDQLRNLCLIVERSMETFHFDNNDTVLHESIKSNNPSLIASLIRHKFNVNIDGELGTPLVTAIHCDNHLATELLLNHGADLTHRHIDWPYLTLYEYCIQFNKIDAKSLIDKYISSILKRHEFEIIQKLIDDGWTIYLRKIIRNKCTRIRRGGKCINGNK